MAQSRLTAAGGCAVILLAGAAEAAAPGPTVLLTAADYAVGTAFAVCGTWLSGVGMIHLTAGH